MLAACKDQEDNIQLSIEDDEEMMMNMELAEDASKDEDQTTDGTHKDSGGDTKTGADREGSPDVDPHQYLWATNLETETMSEDFRSVFEKYGTVLRCKLMLDWSSSEVELCGFVKMASRQEAEKALAEISNSEKPPFKMQVKTMEDKKVVATLESLKASKKAHAEKTRAVKKPSRKEEETKSEEPHYNGSQCSVEDEGALRKDHKENEETSKGSKGPAESQHLWVTNLEITTEKTDLRNMFSEYGEVLKVKRLLDYHAQVCAYIKMASKEAAAKAVEGLSNLDPAKVKMISDSDIVTKLAKIKADKKSFSPQPARPQRSAPTSEREKIKRPQHQWRAAVRRPKVPYQQHHMWEREKRKRYYDMVENDRRKWMLREEQNQVMRMKVEIMSMKREMSQLMNDTKRSIYSRTDAEKRPYYRDDILSSSEDDWQPRKKPSYHSDNSRSSRYSHEWGRQEDTAGASSSYRQPQHY